MISYKKLQNSVGFYNFCCWNKVWTLRNWDNNGKLHPHHEDLVQIITVFNCKLQGKYAGKARKLVKELIEEGGEDHD